jgi:serine/threonine protein kinase/tetratricopeptide (TPR) repeat protein
MTVHPGPDAGLRAWFEAAMEQPAPLRADWLDAHCADAAMRARVRDLIETGSVTAEQLLERVHDHFAGVETHALLAQAADWAGKQIGAYVLDRCIGEGGMSFVYRAHADTSGTARTVAVKILRIGLHAEDRQKAFRREREALAKLDHPNIARLLDGGIVEGTPYLVLDFIDGTPLTTHAQQQALDLRARLGLFATMCRAVEAAHRMLIVHRDLKPSNVLVTRDGQVKLLDFGIAKLLDADEPDTRTTRIAFTPDYAAPEQLTNDPVSTATDVFALGVILHELLTGTRPERGWTTRPSVIASRLGDEALPAGLHLRALHAGLVGDLDNVILKAIDPDPERRYGSAGAFADDIERHLAGQPVAAHPPSRWYRTRKFVQRHRGAVSLSAALGLGLIVSLGIAVERGREAAVQARAAIASAATARTESARANAVRDYLLGIFEAAQEQLPEDQRPTPQQLVQAAAATLEARTDLDLPTRAALHAAYGDIRTSMSAHADAADAYARAIALLADDPAHRRDLLDYTLRRAYALSAAGRNSDAVALAEPLIVELRAATDEIAVAGLVSWTDILASAGRFDEAIRSADEVAARAAQLPDRQSPQARFRTLLPGWVRASAGRGQEAVPLLQQALDAWRDSTTPKDREYAGGLSTLALAEYQTGRHEAARTHLEEALTLSRRIFKAPHERLAGMLESLAAMEVQQGNADAAASRIADASAMYSALFGPSHPKVLSARLTAATIDWERLGLNHAIAEYRAITDLCASSRQENSNPDCARTWQNLSNALLHAQRADEALAANDRSLALRKHLFGDRHNEYATALAGRAAILAALRHHDDALDFADRALAILTGNGTGKGIVAANVQRTRVASLRQLKRYDDALAALDDATAIFTTFAAGDRARSADLHGARALIHAAQGDAASARREAAAALAFDPTLGKCNAGDRDAIRRLAAAPD